MPVAVQNLVNGPTTFDDYSHSISLQWEAKGDINGEDVQLVDEEVPNLPRFQKAIQRNIFAVLQDQDEADDAIARQSAAYTKRTDDYDAAAVGAIDLKANNDLIQLPCVGPNARGVAGGCQVAVPVREASQYAAPTLCAQHISLAPEFIPSESGAIDSQGKPVVTWSRLVIDPRQTH